jgi:hypothetical protein
MKTKILGLGLATCLLAAPAFAQDVIGPIGPTPPVVIPVYYPVYYGNVSVTGSNGCSAVQGTFPATTSVTGGVYYVNILIQNPPIGLPLQFLTLIVGPSPNYTVFDPSLFPSTVGGTYTGAPSISGNILTLGTAATPLDLKQTPPAATANASTLCDLSITGQLYYSPG